MQLGPGLAALVVELHTEMGVPLAKVTGLLPTRLRVEITTGSLVRLLQQKHPYSPWGPKVKAVL